MEKITNDSFEISDIPDYLEVFVEICNNTKHIHEHFLSWNRTFHLKIGSEMDYHISTHNGHFCMDFNHSGQSDIIIELDPNIVSQILSGEKDATQCYLDGSMKITGNLPDAVKFRLLTEIVREELENYYY